MSPRSHPRSRLKDSLAATGRYQLLPPLTSEEYAQLKGDIRARGAILVPVELDGEGEVLDGHHRLRAWHELREEGAQVGEYPVVVRVGLKTEAQKRSHVRALNLQRRHLSRAVRRGLIEDELRDRPEASDRAVASILGVSHSTIGIIRRRLGPTGGIDQLKRVGRDGRRRRMPSSQTIIARSDRQARQAIGHLSLVPAEALPERLITADDLRIAARIVHRETRRDARLERLRAPSNLKTSSESQFAVVLADPPWRYTGASDPSRRADNHYPTMSHEDLCALPVSSIAARNAILYLWAPPPKLEEALKVMSAWGFEYRTCAVWDKERPGLGSWWRLQHELLLLGVRGDFPPPAPGVRCSSLIRAPRGAHSAKPTHVHQMIARMHPDVPAIELFARKATPGWTVWGNEVNQEEPARS